MSLEFVDPVSAEVYPNILLYGPPKTGKTTGALSAAGLGGVLLMGFDLPGRYAYGIAKYGQDGRIVQLKWRGLSDFREIGEALMHQPPESEQRMFETVVVDPIGHLHRKLLEEDSQLAVRPSRDSYGDVAVYVERFCRMLCAAPLNVVIVAHDWPSRDESTESIVRWPWTGTTNTSLGARLMGMVDIIGYTGVVQEEDEPPKYVAQLTPTSGRPAGDGLGGFLVAERPYREVDLAEWVPTIRKGLAKQQSKQATKEAQK